MKKLLSTLLAAFCALPLLAQSNIVFTDENGTEIADGTIVTANKPVTDDFGEMLISMSRISRLKMQAYVSITPSKPSTTEPCRYASPCHACQRVPQDHSTPTTD